MPATIHDIAIKAGVSHTTVSRVLNKNGNVSKETQKKVEIAISELNYIPNAFARGLTRSKTSVIGLVVPQIHSQFFGDIIQGVVSTANENGLSVLLFNTDEDTLKEERAIRILQEHRVRGLILTPVLSQQPYNKDYFCRFKGIKTPVVLIDRNIFDCSFDGVYYDDTKAICDATLLLLNEGHKDIVVLCGNPNLAITLKHIDGYIKAFNTYKIPYNKHNIYYGDNTKECAYKQVSEILKRPSPPTAIVTNNKMATIGCLKALLENNVNIPDDIAVVAYGKIEMIDIIQPNITLIEKSEFECGENAMRLLLRRLANPDMAQQKVIMSARLIKRGSEKLGSRKEEQD